MGLKIIVTGGRNYQNKKRVEGVLDDIDRSVGIDILVHGGAAGADTLAALWAMSRNKNLVEFPADWSKYSHSAGPRRNQQMADAGADLCVAFPGNSGTRDMKRKARKANIRVVEIYDDQLSPGPLFDM